MKAYFDLCIAGEDRCLIENYFPGVCQGTYLEVGALDGIRESTTFVFYAQLGWKGINIELDPDNYEALERNRREDMANVHAAICSDSQRTVHYAIGKDEKAVGGIWEYASDAHREKWWPGMTLYQTIPMKCTPLQTIFDKVVGPKKFHFDLAVFDLEGAEYSALLGIDYSRISFGCIVVERNDDGDVNQQIEDLLLAKGYDVTGNPCGISSMMWFVHQDFHGIYSRIKP